MLIRLTDTFATVRLDSQEFSVKQVSVFGLCILYMYLIYVCVDIFFFFSSI